MSAILGIVNSTLSSSDSSELSSVRVGEQKMQGLFINSARFVFSEQVQGAQEVYVYKQGTKTLIS